MEILEDIKAYASNLSTLEIITVVGTVQKGGYDKSLEGAEKRKNRAEEVIEAQKALSKAQENLEGISTNANETDKTNANDVVNKAQKRLADARQAEKEEISKQSQATLDVNYHKNAKAIISQINLVHGNIKTVIGPTFIEEPKYKDIQTFHEQQVEKGHSIVQENIKALKSLFVLVRDTFSS